MFPWETREHLGNEGVTGKEENAPEKAKMPQVPDPEDTNSHWGTLYTHSKAAAGGDR